MAQNIRLNPLEQVNVSTLSEEFYYNLIPSDK